MEAAGKHEDARNHFGRTDPSQNHFARVFRQFKLNRSLRLSLDNGNTLPNTIIFHEICHTQFDKITTAQLAIDGDVEQNQIAQIASEL